jgi:anti-sigma B factor antagonist
MSILDARISTSRFGADACVVAVGGELDLHSVEPLRERLADVIESGCRRVLVDLMGVTFMESATLGVLLGAAKAMRSTGGLLVLVTDDTRITRTLEISGLAEYFHVESSLPEAIHGLVVRQRPQA